MPRPVRAVARASLALIVGLVVTELGLRLCGALLLARAGSRSSSETAGERPIVCVGDSNTYGLYLAGSESYPAELERLLAADAPVPVLNLAVPGQGIHHVVERLPEQLERHRPRAVVVLAGVNNTWSKTEGRSTPLGRALSDLRLVKLARLLAARLSGGRGVPAAEPLPAPPPGEPMEAGERIDLTEFQARASNTSEGVVHRIVDRTGEEVVYLQETNALGNAELVPAVTASMEELLLLCRRAGAQAVILTYPFPTPVLRQLNAALRELAAREEVPLVDLEADLAPYLRAGLLEALAFPDLHPRASATPLIARCVQRELVAAGLVGGAAPALPEPAELLAGFEPAVHALTLSGTTLLVEGSHGEAARVLFSTAAGNAVVAGHKTGLGKSEVFASSKRDPRYSFSIGPEGKVELPLDENLLAQCAEQGLTLRACALFGPQSSPGTFRHSVSSVLFEPPAEE